MIYIKNISISVFFPAYNDASTIPLLVEDAVKTLKKITDNYEVIIVDDGSKDNTAQVADRLSRKYKKVRAIHHDKNNGYGAALKTGIRNSRKDFIFYTDGDGQYDAKELEKLVDNLNGADMVNGYKLKRSDKVYRIILGKMYNWMSKLLFNIKLKDIDCDFRLMKRSIFNKISLESNSGVICVEMMRKIQKAGFKIVEVPVHHYPRVSGQSQFFKLGRIILVFEGLAWQWWKLMVLEKLKKWLWIN